MVFQNRDLINQDYAHEFYMREGRHWSAHSEAYTGADSLVTAMRHGWEICGQVYRHDVLLGPGRVTSVFYFELIRDGQTVTMPVVRNPFVMRLLRRYNLHISQPAAPREISITEAQEAEKSARLVMLA